MESVAIFSEISNWTTSKQYIIADFVKELKGYFGSPLSIEKIDSKKFDEQNTWQVEAEGSISEAIDMSTRFCMTIC